jgi:general stress protein 26
VQFRGTIEEAKTMSERPYDKLQDLMREFDTAMLVTRTATGELRSRPMAVAEVEENGALWFFTECDSAKMDEITRDPHVNVAMQSSRKFVSISGTATASDDRAKIAELWDEAWKEWFPGGQDDPSLLLLRVDGAEGEYWDNSGASGIRYLIEAGKAYLTGTKPDVANDPHVHAKVEM